MPPEIERQLEMLNELCMKYAILLYLRITRKENAFVHYYLKDNMNKGTRKYIFLLGLQPGIAERELFGGGIRIERKQMLPRKLDLCYRC